MTPWISHQYQLKCAREEMAESVMSESGGWTQKDHKQEKDEGVCFLMLSDKFSKS